MHKYPHVSILLYQLQLKYSDGGLHEQGPCTRNTFINKALCYYWSLNLNTFFLVFCLSRKKKNQTSSRRKHSKRNSGKGVTCATVNVAQSSLCTGKCLPRSPRNDASVMLQAKHYSFHLDFISINTHLLYSIVPCYGLHISNEYKNWQHRRQIQF